MARRIKVDMTGVESFNRCPEGEWLARLKKIEETRIQGSGDDGLKAQFEVIKGEAKGCSVFETFSLGEKALWKLKSFLDAAGMKSDGKLSLDLDKLEGKTCVIDVVHTEYNGQKRANISAYLKELSEPDDDDDEDEDDEDFDEDDEEDEEEPPKKSKKAPVKKSSKKHPEPEEEDEDEEDEDEDEEPEPPKKSKKSSSKKGKKVAKKPVEPEDDDDDDDWEDDDD